MGYLQKVFDLAWEKEEGRGGGGGGGGRGRGEGNEASKYNIHTCCAARPGS